MSPAVAFPFVVESSGITLLSDESIDVTGPEITSIRCQGTIYVCSADNGLKRAVFLLFVLLTQMFLQVKMFCLDNHLNATISTEKV
jgi:hypothetical protein